MPMFKNILLRCTSLDFLLWRLNKFTNMKYVETFKDCKKIIYMFVVLKTLGFSPKRPNELSKLKTDGNLTAGNQIIYKFEIFIFYYLWKFLKQIYTN